MPDGAKRPLIVGLGEALIRLSTNDLRELSESRELTLHVAGAELNLLIAASALGTRSRWLTRLAANDLGAMMRRHAQSYDLEVDAHDEPGARAGLFFFEQGVPPRPSRVTYDRRDSAASHLKADEFDWVERLEGAAAAHVSGITCALGEEPAAAVLRFFEAARSLGVMTSFDVNYRSQLWDRSRARESLRRVLPLVDTLFASPDDLTLLTQRDESFDALAREVRDEFGVTTMVLRERRHISALEIGVRVSLVGDDMAVGEARGHVVDELGAGDAAAGAFLAAMLLGEPTVVCVERGARAFARMLTIRGDAWSGTLRDLDEDYFESPTVLR